MQPFCGHENIGPILHGVQSGKTEGFWRGGAVVWPRAVYHPRKINPNLVKPLGLVFCHLQQNMILIDSRAKALETDLG